MTDDTDIQPKRSVPDIITVPFVPADNALLTDSRTMITLDLGHTGNAGPHEVPELIAFYTFRKPAAVGMGMWSRSYYAHASQQYIHELGEFINIRFAKEIAEGRHPEAATGGRRPWSGT